MFNLFDEIVGKEKIKYSQINIEYIVTVIYN